MVGQQRLDARRRDAELARQQRHDRAHLHLAEARQLAEALLQILAALGLAPDASGVAGVALLDERAERAHAVGHGGRVAVQRGRSRNVAKSASGSAAASFATSR